ncbi:MAG: serine/threonine-protein kinase [Steroidobacteraceae bacterium]
MSAPPNPGSVTANESGFAAGLPLTLAADSAMPSVQQPQLEPSDHESQDDDPQIFDVAVHPTDPAARGAALFDDTPTVPLLPGRQQLAATSEMGVELATGSVLRSRYVLEDVIGCGGTSIIFRAKDLHRVSPPDMPTNFVAVKLLRAERRAEPLALTRLKREFRQMQCLSHPGIVRVFDLDCDSNVWFISMELVAGRTVKIWMETPGSHANALRIIGTCCEALEHAHSLGILHGDLKPTNVMVADDGTAKLIDFGSAPSPGSRIAAGSDATLAVTPLYASPQILAGNRAERRDDVFSLACLSYSILSGGLHPFGGRPSLEDGRAKSAPTYVRAIPVGLFEVIERGLSAERERRPASVREFLRDLTDADRRRRADARGTATPARDNVGAVRHPRSVMHAADRVSRSTLPSLFKEIRLAARSLTRTSGTGIALAAFGRFGGVRGSYRRAQPFVRLIALVFAMVGAAVLFRFDTHRDVIRTAELPPEGSATSSELVATARANTEVFLETRPLRHDSGVISFEASTVHASAVQSLIAISVKRLQATRRRGAFAWRVERGTAHPGVDYQRIEPQVVRFIEGQAIRTLFIPLINTRATLVPRGPRTFTVALQQVAGGPALGRFARVTVTIDPPPTSSPLAVYQARAENRKPARPSACSPGIRMRFLAGSVAPSAADESSFACELNSTARERSP